MLRKLLFIGAASLGATASLVTIGCSGPGPTPTSSDTKSSKSSGDSDLKHDSRDDSTASRHDEGEHGHEAGAHGGIIVSLGRDSYHVEAIVTNSGELRLYTLGNDESRVLDIAAQELQGYVKPVGASDSTPLDIRPQPQPGDGEEKASLFVAQLPEAMIGKSIDVTVPNMTIDGERFRLNFKIASDSKGHAEEARSHAAPKKTTSEAERKLYLEPGGLYTQADIEANGNVTAPQKFASFQASHDLDPQIGDKICPVTLTKANPECSWVIGGKAYEFCCPPCVDEFVALAKNKPDDVKLPEEYVKGE